MRGRPLTVYIDEGIMEKIKLIAENRKVSLSYVIREALERFLEEEICNQARKSLLEWIKEQEITEKRKQQLLQVWNEYQEKEKEGKL